MVTVARRFTAVLHVVLVIGTTLLATAGCAPAFSPEHPLAIRVIVGPDLDTLPLRHGIERGYFAAEGLTVTTIPEPDPYTGLHTLVDGGADIAFGGGTVVVEAAYRGLDVKILAEAGWLGDRAAAIVVRGDGTIPDLAALAGHTIGAPSPGSQDRILAHARLDNDSGAVPSDHVQWVPMDPPDHTASRLAHKDADAVVLREPWLTDAIHAHGFTALAYLSDTSLLHPTSTYVATTAWAEQHPGAVTAYQRALHQAARDLRTDRAALNALAVRHLRITPDTAARLGIPLYPTHGPSVSQLQRIPNLMHRYGILAEPYRIAALVVSPDP
ncbi:ABC transporter substrate-binding protein [Amycolatopsis sp. NPDC049868]|uniref:ABC transporter substrate-binding protein n=1 Tax=Amycolatopsis sp. NPDC049868 TaxID=3363934 RepID=UPI0037B83873